MRSFPPDVVILDSDSLVHARFGRGRTNPRVLSMKSYRIAPETFTPSPVTPHVASETSLAETLRRLRMESGKWDKVSLLLPDSWFRMNIVDLPSIPERPGDALEVVRWSLKRTIPVSPDQLRITYTVLSRGEQAKVLVLSALDATLGALERVFAAAGLEVVLIEPLGLSLWNAITVHEGEGGAGDRLFFYVRDAEFTTAVFRGAQPVFIRSRNLSAERTVDQEIRLSAGYLRDSLNVDTFATCYVAGQRGPEIYATIAQEFNTQVRPVLVKDYAEDVPSGMTGFDAELTACTGVFTG